MSKIKDKETLRQERNNFLHTRGTSMILSAYFTFFGRNFASQKEVAQHIQCAGRKEKPFQPGILY